MGDDEINELLARGDHEFPIFQAMDAQREEEATTSWKAVGGTGPPPERLMTDEEVPEVYRCVDPLFCILRPSSKRVLTFPLFFLFFNRRDVVIASSEKDEDEGRGWRVKAPVVYSEGLNDELFFKVSFLRSSFTLSTRADSFSLSSCSTATRRRLGRSLYSSYHRALQGHH